MVANEVKNLANQTAKATGQIGGQIAAIQAATAQAVAAIRGIVGVIGEINGIAGSIAAAVEEQSAATQEIARSAQAAAGSTQQAAADIGQVASANDETSQRSEAVRGSAGSVRDRILHMKEAIDGIVRSTGQDNRHNTERHTLNVAIGLTLAGERRSCLLQDIALIGTAILDRSLPLAHGAEFEAELPAPLGTWKGAVVAVTEFNTHVRFDMDEAQAGRLEEFIAARVKRGAA